MGLGQVTRKKLFADAAIRKVFETNPSFTMKQRTTGKVQFRFLSSFLLTLTKLLLWGKTGH